MFEKLEDGKAFIKEFNPMLVKKGKKYFLHISYQTDIKLNSTPLESQRVVAVDLGLTNSAVCSSKSMRFLGLLSLPICEVSRSFLQMMGVS